MTDDELRAMVRDSIARHLGVAPVPDARMAFDAPPRGHASHALLPVLRGGDADGMCIIEPAVRCTHCGYCQSYGH